MTVICVDSAGEQGAAARAAGIRVSEIGFRGLERSVLLNPFPLILRFRRAIQEASPDVVHCFLYWSYLLGVPIARSAGVPVVVSSRRSLSCRRHAAPAAGPVGAGLRPARPRRRVQLRAPCSRMLSGTPGCPGPRPS